MRSTSVALINYFLTSGETSGKQEGLAVAFHDGHTEIHLLNNKLSKIDKDERLVVMDQLNEWALSSSYSLYSV